MKDRKFWGYHCYDVSMGTRNHWSVVPLVFCENRNILITKDALENELGYAQPETYRNQVHELLELYKFGGVNSASFKTEAIERSEISNPKPKLFPNIDSIKFLTHEGACGGTRQDANTLCKLFAADANKPNVAGITVLSLGCQNAENQVFMDAVKKRNPNFDKPILFFQQQKGTEFELISDAIRATFLGLIKANKIERKPASLSKLNICLNCGGLDGFSGISANPAIGHLSDIIVALVGRTFLTELPELHGVEQELLNRCETEEKVVQFENLMREYSYKASAIGSAFAFNPSPGNIKED